MTQHIFSTIYLPFCGVSCFISAMWNLRTVFVGAEVLSLSHFYHVTAKSGKSMR